MGARCALATLLLVTLLVEGQEEYRCSSRVKRYALEGSRWRVDELTYRIDKYSTKLPKATVDKIIRQAFDLWEDVTNLKFTERKSGKAHMGTTLTSMDLEVTELTPSSQGTVATLTLTMTRTGRRTRAVCSCF